MMSEFQTYNTNKNKMVFKVFSENHPGISLEGKMIKLVKRAEEWAAENYLIICDMKPVMKERELVFLVSARNNNAIQDEIKQTEAGSFTDDILF